MADATREAKLTAPTRGTHAAWVTSDPIIAEGVLCLVSGRTYAGSIEYVVGDGTSHYSQLAKFGDALAALGHKNVANGVAGLDTNGVLSLAQIPVLSLDKIPPLTLDKIPMLSEDKLQGVTITTTVPTVDQMTEGKVVYVVEA